MKKRILAIMLACFMIVSLLPMQAFAVETCPGDGNHATENCNWKLVDEVTGKCGEWNYSVYECLDCGDLFADNLVQNTNTHEWSEWTNVEGSPEDDCENVAHQSRTCSICNAVEERDLNDVIHVWVTIGGNCKDGMLQQCQVCNEFRTLESDEHAWSEHPVRIELAPDEINLVNGTAIYVCTFCGVEKEVVILHHGCGEKLGQWEEAVAPTCTEDGVLGHFTCTVCGRYFDEDMNEMDSIVDPALGHTYTEVIEEKLPVCNEAGYRIFKCVRCDEEITEILEGPAHMWKLEAHIDPTCTTYGFDAYGCELCGEAYVEPIAPQNHKDTTTELVVDPTCTEAGSLKEFCYVCGTVVSEEVLPATGHNMVVDEERSIDATCKDYSVTYEYCANGCGEEKVTVGEELNANNHANVGFETYVAPTCTEDGYWDFWCYDCNYWYHLTKNEDPSLAATGHNIVLIETVPPTCAVGGYEVWNCENCGECYEERNAVEDFDHAPIYYGLENVPEGNYDIREQRPVSCVIDGLYVYTCLECGDIFLVVVSAHGHIAPENYDEWVIAPVDTTCTTAGHTGTYNCVVCGELVEGEAEEAYGHNVTFVDTKNPTCTEDGHIRYWYCDRCDVYFTDEELNHPIDPEDPDFILEATGHDIVVIDEHYAEMHDEYDYLGYSYTHLACSYGCGIEYIINFEWAGQHDFTVAERVEATCDQDGYVRYECSCGKVHDEILPALGHTFDEICANNGDVCERCGAECNVEHNWDGWNRIEATCVNGTYDLRVCLDCGIYDVNPVDERLGNHTWGPYEEQFDADGNPTGILTCECLVCGEPGEPRYADKYIDYTVSTDRDMYVVGNTIAVTISLSGNYSEVWGFDLDLYFDNYNLVFTGYEANTEVFDEIFLVVDNGHYLSIGANAKDDVQVSELDVVTLYFEVVNYSRYSNVVNFELIHNATLSYKGVAYTAGVQNTSCNIAMMMDLDLDGVITLADARLAYRHFTGIEELNEEVLILADLDFNGNVTLAEVRAIYEAFLN